MAPTAVELRSLDLPAVQQLVEGFGASAYRAQQIFRWIHRFGATSVEAMTNVPKDLRQQLEHETTLAPLVIDEALESSDGSTKLRLRCDDGEAIESVLIPRDAFDPEGRITLCVSSQVGCALGCRFCATATMGMRRNLRVSEIVDQVYRASTLLASEQRISNLVLMGMGEPLANLDHVIRAVELLCHSDGLDLSPRRITVSTAGLVPGIRELGRRMRQVGLAISLHATTDEVRDQLMPINKRWPLAQLMAALRDYPLPRRRRITFEYVLLPGVNDTDADVRRLPRLLDGIPSKINLLSYNPARTDQPQWRRPSPEAIDTFAEKVRDSGLTVTVRQSRGLDIAAACGQLALEASRPPTHEIPAQPPG